LKSHRYRFPIEQKLFDVYVRLTGQLDPGAKDYVPAVDAQSAVRAPGVGSVARQSDS